MASTSVQRRTPLSREAVIGTAIALADDGGLESVSMRAIAKQLGVTAMSIYNHVANKDEILDGMIETVIAQIELPEEANWKRAVRRSSLSAHDVLLRHGWACTLWLSRQSMGPARLRHGDWLLRALRRGGLSPDVVYHAFHMLESHILGVTIQQLSFPYQGDELADMAAEFLEQLPAEKYPHLADHIEAHLTPRSGTVSGFEFALDLILDGLERTHETTLNDTPGT